ncbi:CsgG/HfaB family protein [Haloferula sp. A504]|uniref:CsgG/HfaB family protein n=1 Tax=Haloferula sp. A504 TaxID=3373601 RepID=UPI0031C6D619|nr:CsgG/HfaB family protein [Verrucomicrobiaceae bacterium E54]
MIAIHRFLRPAAMSIAAAFVLPVTSSAEEEVAQPLSAAVLDFADGNNGLDGVGASVAALLQVQLTVHSEAILVERAELNEILGEQELTLSGAVTPAQAAKVGQLTGAEVLVSGRVFAVQDRIHVVAKVISASTSRVFGATAAYDRGKPVEGAVEKLGADVAKILNEKAADLRGGASIEERTLAEVKKMFIDQNTGKVYVHIPETIIQAIVPDPAAQTEIGRTLEAAGWEVVEAEADADLVVRGEAFAETGVRRGNLWFTRARLEFTVKDAKGKVLKTDRIVAGNVDLTQAVSAKGALQKTGLLATPVIGKAWTTASDEKE